MNESNYLNQANSPRPAKVFRRVAVTALAVTLLAGAATSGVAAASSTAVPKAAAGQDRPELQKAIEDVVDYGFPGVQIRVRDDRGEWVGSAGVRKLGETGESGKPPTNGRFRIGSGTKAFVSTVVLQLVAEGKVGLDAPAADYLPQFELNRAITVRHLLQNSSGLFSYTGSVIGGKWTPGLPATGKEWVDNRFHSYQPEELVRYALSRSPVFDEPGENWDYSNTNHTLAALLIENVTGRTYGQEITRRILRPLGLSGTSLPGTRTTIPGPHSHGYFRYQDTDGQWKVVDVTRQDPSILAGAGDMISTTKDMSTFLSALLRGKLLPAPLLTQMTTPHPKSPIGYGFGLSVQDLGPTCGGKLVNINGAPTGGSGQLTYSTIDGKKTMSAAISMIAAPADGAEAGGKAGKRLLGEVFCGGQAAG